MNSLYYHDARLFDYYKGRRHRRESLDLRGITLTANSGGRIYEIESGLLHYWVEWQDQPDEIVVSDILIYYALHSGQSIEELKKKKNNASVPNWRAGRSEYRSKFTILPDQQLWIPVFESGFERPPVITEINTNRQVVFED